MRATCALEIDLRHSPNRRQARTGGRAMELLKLIALDDDDLAVVSTHVQDSVAKVGDILYRPAERRVVVVVNRFDWEGAQCGDGPYRRRRSALRFDRVNALKARNVACGDKEAVLNLLDRKSTRLNSSHTVISYAVFC